MFDIGADQFCAVFDSHVAQSVLGLSGAFISYPRPAGSFDSSSKPFCKMPRIAVDTASASLLSGEVDLSTASIAQMVKENVDLEKTFGVSSQFAETLRGAFEEMTDSTARGADELLCCLLLCNCCVECCNWWATTRPSRRHEEDRSSYLESPQQQSMGDSGSIEAPRADDGFHSLLDLSAATSEDLRAFIGSKEMINREKLVYFLFGSKFGQPETDQLKECVEQLKAAGPDLIDKDHPDFQGLLQKAKGKDMKAFAQLLRLVGSAAVLKHGAAVAEKGLDAMKLGQCGKVLCAGDLSYELDETGLHKCTWSCPGDQMPDQCQVVAADFRGAEKKLNMTVQELEEKGKMFEEDAQKDPEHFEQSGIYKSVKGLKFKFHNAFSEDPLKLFQMKAPTDLGSEYPNAMRYHGKCRSKEFELAERVLFTGSHPSIPTGGIVKVVRLPGKTWFKETLKSDEVEVKYLGEKVIVQRSELKRQNLARVKLDEDLQDWMKSTGDTLEVDLSTPAHDPSRRQSKDTFWFPLAPPKTKDE